MSAVFNPINVTVTNRFNGAAYAIVYNDYISKYDVYFICKYNTENIETSFWTESAAENYINAANSQVVEEDKCILRPITLLPYSSFFKNQCMNIDSSVIAKDVLTHYGAELSENEFSVYSDKSNSIWESYRYLRGDLDFSKNISVKAILTPDKETSYSNIFSNSGITSDIFNTGVVVNLHVQRWRALTTLSPQDLGLSTNDKVQKELMSLGNKILLPKSTLSELDSIENSARQNLAKHSIHVPWGYFVPDHLFESWNKKNTEIKEQYLSTGSDIVNCLDDLYKEVITSYKKYAATAYSTYSKDSSEMSDEWETNYITAIKSKFPHRDNVKDSFKYSCTFLQIPNNLINPTLKQIVTTNEGLTPYSFYNKLMNSVIQETKDELSDVVTSLVSAKLTKKGKIHEKTLNRVRAIEETFLSKIYPNDKSKKVASIKNTLNLLLDNTSVCNIQELSNRIEACLITL